MNFIGSTYGGYLIPDNIKEIINKDSVVISAGIGQDCTFDEELHRITGCNVIMIDPSDEAVEMMMRKRYPWVKYNDCALSFAEGIITLYEPEDKVNYQSWSINNKGRRRDVLAKRLIDFSEQIDLLKIDIEHLELLVIADMICCNIYPKVICVEIHDTRETESMIEILSEYDFENRDNVYTFVKREK